MSREILFRGKTIKSRFNEPKWVYGFYTLTNDNHGMKPSIITGTEKDCSIPEFIDPATVGQFTGLCDKNGVRIFEGDMFDLGDKDIQKAVIEFRDYAFRLCLYGIYGQMTEHGWDEDAGDCELLESEIVTYYDLDTLEVIGNIYDKEEQDALQGKFAQEGRCTFDE